MNEFRLSDVGCYRLPVTKRVNYLIIAVRKQSGIERLVCKTATTNLLEFNQQRDDFIITENTSSLLSSITRVNRRIII